MAGSSSWPRTLDFHSKDQGFESPTRYRFIDKTDICGGVKRIGTPERVVQKSYQAHNLMILASTARPATNQLHCAVEQR